jgi:hypothetical protein
MNVDLLIFIILLLAVGLLFALILWLFPPSGKGELK